MIKAPEAPRVNIELLSSIVQADPFPIYRKMRDEFPICRIEPDGAYYAISRDADVRTALKSPNLFSSRAARHVYETEHLSAEARRDYSVFSQDPPEHTKNRQLINKAFVRRVIDELHDYMTESAEKMVSSIEPGKPFDFLTSAGEYAASILTRVTGTSDVQTYAELKHWLSLSEVLKLDRPPREHMEKLEHAQIQQRKQFYNVVNSRRSKPQSDLVSELLGAKVDGEGLSDKQIVSLLELLLAAGFDTISYSLCHAIMFFTKRPDILAQLRADPESIPNFIEELLRYDPPTHQLLRKTTEEVELSGCVIPSGSFVLLMIGSANRDERRYENPDEFVLSRFGAKEHLAFGIGAHVCVGSALARAEIKIALTKILERYSNISCAKDTELDWLSSLNVRATTALPAIFS